MNAKRKWLVALIVGLACIAFLSVQAAQALERFKIQWTVKAVVQIVAADQGRGGRLIPKWSGSGTIITPDGLILTNCHVALPSAMWEEEGLDYDALVISLTTRSDQPPTPAYLAEVVQYDPDLDLAVLRITSTLDGNPVEPGTLNLPAVPIGDSDALEIGDPLYIFGYPDIGGETITMTAGTVSGFSSSRGVTGRAWIKTDTTVAGGNSGGAALNDAGDLVGIPTQFGSGGNGATVDCRPYGDTNGDGKIDENDACIPLGGFINALRPVNLALPLIEAAGLDLKPTVTPEPRPRPTGAPTVEASISRPFFATGVNDCDQPVMVVQSFPSGTEEIYFFFDYADFSDGATFQPVVRIDGEEVEGLFDAVPWGWGPSGNFWLSISGSPLADGEYEFAIQYEGEELGSATVTVGGEEEDLPAFSDLTFSLDGEEGCTLPAGGELVGTVSYDNIPRGFAYSYVWYYERESQGQEKGTPLNRASGTVSFSLVADEGSLPEGTYRLEIYGPEGEMLATGDVVLSGAAQQAVIGPITFAEGVDRQGRPVRPGSSFRSGLKELYAFFTFEGMQDGWSWTRYWSIDGEVVTAMDDSWSAGESGQKWVSISRRRGPLPDGEYKLDLYVEGVFAQSGTCTIGGGAHPTPTPRPARQGVQINGYVTDAATGRGIRGAVFIVLQPGISVDDFQWTDEEVYTWAETDRNGYFELPQLLARGECYSMIVAAKGYLTVAEDDVCIPNDLESPYEVEVMLQRAR
jgi:S1-C subfamily serine protease